jgi:cell division protease FtsH
LILVVLEAISSRNGAKDVTTSQMVAYINDHQIKEITFVEGDQVVQATLQNGDEVQSHWLQDQGIDLLNSVRKTDTDAV